MAERRMFAKQIVDSDAFLDMPLSTQALYFHLAMRADDDGFLNNAKKIQRMLGCSDDDYKILLAKNFIIPFENGVCVIKHWRVHNYIQKDRYKSTIYVEEAKKLSLKNNSVYTLDTSCIQNVDGLEPQVRLGKVSKEKNKAQKSDDFVLPDWLDLSLWNDFKEMRIKCRKKMTDRAEKLMIAKLANFHSRGIDTARVLEKSILKSWTDVYEPDANDAAKQIEPDWKRGML
jgi:hypothetical protein